MSWFWIGWILARPAFSQLRMAADSPAGRRCARSGNRASVRAIDRARGDVNQAQADGMTALHWAVYHDDLETAKLLVDARADVKTVNRYGVTPLSLACTNGNAAIVELLLDAGPTRTPRFAAARRP